MQVLFQQVRGPSRLHWALAAVALMGGCSRYQSPGIPPPDPVGVNVNAIIQTQIEGALADKLTVYRHEWAHDGDTLGEYGTQHVDEILPRVDETDYPLLVEQSPDAPLDEQRREFLVHYLADHRVANADQRVIIGRPLARGETAEDSVRLYQNRPAAGGGR